MTSISIWVMVIVSSIPQVPPVFLDKEFESFSSCEQAARNYSNATRGRSPYSFGHCFEAKVINSKKEVLLNKKQIGLL